jgi:hypothetical protein
MPNATITSTASTFGTISGTFASDQSTVTGTIAGIITGTLTGSVGVPGPQGPQGEPGQGVAPGGTAYQILAKVDGTDYNTEWIDDKFAQWGNIYGEITDQLDLIQKFGYYLPLAGGSLNQDAGINMFGTRPASANTGTTVYGGWGLKVQKYTDITKSTTIEYDGLNVYDGASHMQVMPTGLTFPDASVQTFAFPGFNGYATESWVSSNYVPKSGGELTGSIYFTNPNPVSLETSDLGWNGLTVYSDQDPAVDPMRVTSSGLQFPDNTTQTTGFPGFAGYATESWVYGRGYITAASVASTYAPLASPVFTGDARAVTPATSDNDTSIATTAFVKAQGYITSAPVTSVAGRTGAVTLAVADVSGAAPTSSPNFTGTPLAPTAADGTSSTQIATTAFVQSAIIAGSAHAETLQATVRNNTGATLSPFTVVYINGALGNNATVAKAQANSEATSSGTFAVTQAAISNNADGIVISAGVLSNVDTSAYTDGDKLYLSPTVAGGVTTTKPSAPNHLVYVGVVTRSHPTQGTVSVRIQNGYELDELHDVAISSKTDLDLLAYESSTSLWKNKSFSTLGLAGLASPTFTGTPSLPTGTTATTQTAGDNTTKLATTAFVTAAVPAFASVLNTSKATSTTTTASPASLLGITFSDKGVIVPMSSAFTTATSGAGASASLYWGALLAYTPVSVAGYAGAYYSTGTHYNGLTNRDIVDWTKTVGFSCVTNRESTAFPSGVLIRITLGKSASGGTLVTRGIGLEIIAGQTYVKILTHNGTTLTTTNSTYPLAGNLTGNYVHQMAVISYGNGTAELFVDGVSYGTASGAPTTASTGTQNRYSIETYADGTQGATSLGQLFAQNKIITSL